MNKIFCLEPEWDQTLHDLKKKSPVLPLLDFLENAIKVDYTFRQVATDKTNLDLIAFAEKDANRGIFEGRNVHFGSCSTLKMNKEEILHFKRLTKARMITGYTEDVDFTSSFIFETWLLNAMWLNSDFAAKRINDLAENEMPYYTKKFGFEAF